MRRLKPGEIGAHPELGGEPGTHAPGLSSWRETLAPEAPAGSARARARTWRGVEVRSVAILEVEPHLGIARAVLLPVLAHLHLQEEMHGSAEELSDLAPRLAPDRLDSLAALAEDDPLVAVAGDVDHLVDAGGPVLPLLPVLGLHRQLIGKFLVEPERQLLARDLGCDHPHRQIGDLILGVEPGAFGQLGG